MKYFVFAFSVLFSFSAMAFFPKPRIEMVYHEEETKYIHAVDKVKCGDNPFVLGCARELPVFEASVNCGSSLITFDVYSKNREIEITTLYPKESCEYKAVLDHEETHMQIHRTVMEAVAKKASQAMLDVYDHGRLQKQSCTELAEAVAREYNDYLKVYLRERQRLNNEFDVDDFGFVFQECKTPPKIEVEYKPAEITYTAGSGFGIYHSIRLHPEIDLNISSIKIMAVENKREIMLPERYSKYSCEYEKAKAYYKKFFDERQKIYEEKLNNFAQEIRVTYEMMLGVEERYDSVRRAIIAELERTQKYIEMDMERFQQEYEKKITFDFLKECSLN